MHSAGKGAMPVKNGLESWESTRKKRMFKLLCYVFWMCITRTK